MGGWSEGAREACKSARLRPDSTREFWPEGVCGLGAPRSRGKRAGCALEAGFHPGGGVEASLKPRVSKTLYFTGCLYISASVLLQNLVFYSVLWGRRESDAQMVAGAAEPLRCLRCTLLKDKANPLSIENRYYPSNAP